MHLAAWKAAQWDDQMAGCWACLRVAQWANHWAVDLVARLGIRMAGSKARSLAVPLACCSVDCMAASKAAELVHHWVARLDDSKAGLKVLLKAVHLVEHWAACWAARRATQTVAQMATKKADCLVDL